MVTLLRSNLLSVPHGFPTREGGVSLPPFESLNLGFSVADDPWLVRENLARLANAGHFSLARLATVQQVHGDAVVVAPESTGEAPFAEADATISQRQGQVLGIRVADCVPILMEDAQSQTVAAVHSGWKGTDLEIAARTVEALSKVGTKPSDLRVVLGPHIRSCCYQVSHDLAQRFDKRFGPDVVTKGKDGPHLNLASAVALSLQRAGVPSANVQVLEGCTSCDLGRFFSHRRDKGRSGRHMAFICCDFH